MVESNDDYQPGFLLKFIDKQFVDAFVNKGQLHFSQLGYFIDLEKETGDGAIGDKFEGSRLINPDPDSTTIILSMDNKEFKFHGKKDGVLGISSSHIDDDVRKWGIISFCNINLMKDGEMVFYDEENSTGKIKLKQSVVNDLYKLSDEGRRVPVLIDARGLLNVMKTAFNKKRRAQISNVNYYSETSYENISLKAYNADPRKVAFLKREKYRYQRETRIALFEPVSYENGSNIKIGSLRNVAMQLTSFDELADQVFTAKGLKKLK